MAAVLFLGSLGTAQADSGCGNLTRISIPASTGDFGPKNELKGSTVSINGNCDVQITVGLPNGLPDESSESASEPSVVSLIPRAVKGIGAAGRVKMEGSCEGREVAWVVNVSDTGSLSATADSGDGSVASAYGKITGDDFIGYDVFWHYARVEWEHTEDRIKRGTLYVDDWKRAHWVRISKSNNLTRVSSTKLKGFSKRDFMTPTIAAGNETTVYVYAKLAGNFSCTYASRPYYLWNEFGLDLDYECREGSP